MGVNMIVFFWIADLIIPVTMIILGLVFRYKPPKKINNISGYRTARSMRSQQAWDYAQNGIGTIWIYIGIVLFAIIFISKLISPITKEFLSLIHTGIGIIALFIGIPFVERNLKNKFDDNGNLK